MNCRGGRNAGVTVTDWTRKIAKAVSDATNDIKQNVTAGITLSSTRTRAFLRYRASNGETAAQITSNGENLNRENAIDVGKRRFISGTISGLLRRQQS